MNSTVSGIVRSTNDHPALRTAARIGYAASGLLHLLIAWIAVRIAWFSPHGEQADQSGALRSLAQTPWGTPFLWVMVAGFVGLALWQATEALSPLPQQADSPWAKRLKAVAKAVIYGMLAATTATFARGGTKSSGQDTREATGTVLDLPGGRLLVTVAAAVLLGVAVYHVVKGARERFLQDLASDPGRGAVLAGKIGYIARGIALAVCAGMLGTAAWRDHEGASTGLDGAFKAIADTPFGSVLLTLVAVGFVAFGVYSMVRARYARV